ISLCIFFGGLVEKRHDVALVYSPPLPLGLSAYLLKKFKKTKFVFNVQDLFPEEAILLGLLKNKFLIRIFQIIEKIIYKKADFITVHSPGNKYYIKNKILDNKKIEVVYNWTDTDLIKPGRRDNNFRKELGLNYDFVVSYAGTMGWCQNMRIIVEAANLLRRYSSIKFLLAGEGPEKEKVMRLIKKYKLENIKVFPVFKFNKYIELLNSSDICIINLNKNLSTPVVPSKLLNIMAAGKPVVASVPLSGDTPRIINEAKCGICVSAEELNGFVQAILFLYKNKCIREELGRNGRNYAEKHFSKRICVNQYEEIFFNLIKST
ncbi:MAG: glycosyltransferase family 4 protein, partial [Candidatus Helarchaeota archaeon]